jgi:hypothetical protein
VVRSAARQINSVDSKTKLRSSHPHNPTHLQPSQRTSKARSSPPPPRIEQPRTCCHSLVHPVLLPSAIQRHSNPSLALPIASTCPNPERFLPVLRNRRPPPPGSSSLTVCGVQMHRSYSLRQSRAPTASQIQMPAPPPSSTKGSRFFASNIGLSFRKNTAAAFAPELAKRLTQLIKMEKSLMRSIELVCCPIPFGVDPDSGFS